jgi:hypothetical protein
LAADATAGLRYDAACSAALAGCGRGDAARVDEKTRARCRRLALEWLRADLALWARRLHGAPASRPAVRQALEHWRRDPDLAGVREGTALATLPDGEREAWGKLWAEVEALLTRAAGPPPPGGKAAREPGPPALAR